MKYLREKHNHKLWNDSLLNASLGKCKPYCQCCLLFKLMDQTPALNSCMLGGLVGCVCVCVYGGIEARRRAWSFRVFKIEFKNPLPLQNGTSTLKTLKIILGHIM
jgi:hypothetical protein